MDRKILQIIPESRDVFAQFAKTTHSDASEDRVYCWDLVEISENSVNDELITEVKAMCMLPDSGELCFVDEMEEFIEIYEKC